jgi:cell division inhibitor SulA
VKVWAGRWYASIRIGRFSTSVVWVTDRTRRNYEAQIARASQRAAATRHVRMADRATPPPPTTGWNL